MKHLSRNLLVTALGAVLLPAVAAAQVGVSVNIGEPGFYGQINLGDVPQPQVIYQQPVIVEHVPESAGPPLYLRVPPGHEKHWERHCAEYNACGHRVYFVRDDWYRNQVMPRYHHEGGHDEGRHEGWDHHDHGDRHDHGDHGDHGHGHDHGRGDDDRH